MKEIAFICKCKLVMISRFEVFKCLFMYKLMWMSNSYDLLIYFKNRQAVYTDNLLPNVCN
jgi:hypothetical protein